MQYVEKAINAGVSIAVLPKMKTEPKPIIPAPNMKYITTTP